MTKRNLLFLSPTWPAHSGHGSAIRAGIVLEAFAKYFNVFLLIFQLFRERTLTDKDLRFLCDHCTRVRTVPRNSTNAAIKAALSEFPNVTLDWVHVYRLDSALLVEEALRCVTPYRPVYTLDLDDYESKTRTDIACLYDLTGAKDLAAEAKGRASKYEAMENRYLSLFDHIFVCSKSDGADLLNKYGLSGRLTVIPNAVRLPTLSADLPRQSPAVLLFVGTMDYYPNEDAVLFFCETVLPHLREEVTRPFLIIIAGANPSRAVLSLAKYHSEVRVIGEVQDLSLLYTKASIVIVPVRAGGGTRIKILEACSFRRPIVSTTVGAYGLELTNGTQILIADTPTDLAAACKYLIENDDVAQQMATNAFEWVRTNHLVSNVAAEICRLKAALMPLAGVS